MPAEASRLPVGGNVRVFDLEQPRTVDMPVHESTAPATSTPCIDATRMATGRTRAAPAPAPPG